MVRLKSRYLVVRFAFKDGKLFSSASAAISAAAAGGSGSGSGSSCPLPLLEPASEAALLPPLRAALAAAAGDAGAAAAGPGGGLSVRAFDPSSGVAVVRCPRSSVATLRAAMAASLQAVAHRALRGGGPATLRVCGSAGSARRSAAKFARAAPLLPRASSSSLSSPKERKKSSEKLRAAVLRVREDALRRIAAFDA